VPKKKSNRYFTKATENAIVRYNNSEDYEERNKIYETEIHAAFDKLVENIINRFKFPYIESYFKDLKDEVISFLVLNLGKYSQEKGKAFSYFSVIAKHYLILHNNNQYKLDKKSLYLTEIVDGYTSLEETLAIDDVLSSEQRDMEEFIKLIIEFWDHNLTRIFKKNRDSEIANAIIDLFRQADKIDNFNKKALYAFIREMTGYETSAITRVVNKMANYMKQHREEYHNTGAITDHSHFFTY